MGFCFSIISSLLSSLKAFSIFMCYNLCETTATKKFSLLSFVKCFLCSKLVQCYFSSIIFAFIQHNCPVKVTVLSWKAVNLNKTYLQNKITKSSFLFYLSIFPKNVWISQQCTTFLFFFCFHFSQDHIACLSLPYAQHRQMAKVATEALARIRGNTVMDTFIGILKGQGHTCLLHSL